jgi:hypothetical protein
LGFVRNLELGFWSFSEIGARHGKQGMASSDHPLNPLAPTPCTAAITRPRPHFSSFDALMVASASARTGRQANFVFFRTPRS